MDIVERLRRWPDLPGLNLDRDLMLEAAEEISRLRAQIAGTDPVFTVNPHNASFSGGSSGPSAASDSCATQGEK